MVQFLCYSNVIFFVLDANFQPLIKWNYSGTNLNNLMDHLIFTLKENR